MPAINPDPTIACARRPKNGFRCALLEHQRAAIFPHTLGGACVGRPRACAGSARRLSRTIRGDENVGSGLIDYLAGNPEAGDVIIGMGGVRKLRWRLQGRGKRGGARVIYFFHDINMPVYLMSVYAKNEQPDLSPREQKEFRQAADLLIKLRGKKS